MSDEEPDRSNEKLTPKEAYDLTENQGLTQNAVAHMFDVSQGYVSQRKKEHTESAEVGKSQVSPGDFEKGELEQALSDKKSDDDEYECPECGYTMDYMENEQCPECGTNFAWDQL